MTEPFPVNAASRLRAARERLGLTQAEAGRACEIDRRSWNDMECGRREPTLDRLWGIATVLGIDPHELDPRLASAKPKARPAPKKRGKSRGSADDG